MRIYLIRHADPDYENDDITQAGHAEAAALARRLASMPIKAIHTSPMGRAKATARYTAEAMGLEPILEPWTRELSGMRMQDERWGSLMAWDMPGEAVRPESDRWLRPGWSTAPPFSLPAIEESAAAVAKASDAFLASYGYEREGDRYRIVRSNRDSIALFAHGGFGLTWLSHLLGLPLPLVWSGFWLSPTSVTTILFDERSDRWASPRCLCVGDTSHLYEAGLPVRPRGIKANFD